MTENVLAGIIPNSSVSNSHVTAMEDSRLETPRSVRNLVHRWETKGEGLNPNIVIGGGEFYRPCLFSSLKLLTILCDPGLPFIPLVLKIDCLHDIKGWGIVYWALLHLV